jgi:hypothetical protein
MWEDWATRAFDLAGPKQNTADEPRCALARSDGPDPVDLLSGRMRVLHLEPDEFGSAEVWGFRELQRLCTRCEARAKCADGLADEFSDTGWQDWRDYCPNATTLSILSALRGAGSEAARAPQP